MELYLWGVEDFSFYFASFYRWGLNLFFFSKLAMYFTFETLKFLKKTTKNSCMFMAAKQNSVQTEHSGVQSQYVLFHLNPVLWATGKHSLLHKWSHIVMSGVFLHLERY